MGKIQKLPESLIRLIAAGEVIERPASVLKELVENSLDAGATQISIDLWGAGRSRIRVTDNGEGMSPEDAELALDRHATSKLRSFDDLQKLMTFGFRGEALPSIAAVSRMDLITRTADAPQAWHMRLEGGTCLSTGALGAPPGTIIDIQDLFFNTPARDKFLKRDSTERIHILRTLQELALAHPMVGFQVTSDGKSIMSYAGAKDLRSRLADLWSPAQMEHLVSFNWEQSPLQVQGFINAIPGHQPTKNFQYLFINDRPVQQRALNHAIYEAYHEWLPVGRHPMFVLFLHIDPALIDVNVHPTKREVRCSNERVLYDLLYHQIHKTLQGKAQVPVMGVPMTSWSHSVSGYRGENTETTPAQRRAAMAVQTPLLKDSDTSLPTYTDTALPMVADAPAPSLFPEDIRILGQFQKLYILVEQGEELLLIDQHAAAERVLYEKLLHQAQNGTPQGQRLLTPYIWDLSPDQAEAVRDAQGALTQLGFALDAFGANTFALKEIPGVFPELRHAKRFLEVLLESLQAESHDATEHAYHEAVARAACRAAIKANDPLALAEMTHLLQELAACQRPMTCPHGRPTHIRLPLTELHRRFGRT